MRVMKDSGFPWMGEVPCEWDILRVKDGFFQKKSKAHIEDPVVLSLARSGVKVRNMSNAEGQFAASYYDYNPVAVDDLMLNPMDLISGDNCSISTVEGVISPAYVNLRFKEGFNPKFYHYYFKYQYLSMAFFTYGKGVSFDNRWTLNSETLMKYPLLCPNYEEQTRIADFLDSKCVEIDALSDVIQSEIETLEAYKRSVITEAVTRGIKKDTVFRIVNNTYWNTIPNSWKLVDIKYLFEIVKRIAGKEGFDILSITHGGIKIKDISNNEGQIAADYSNYQFVYPGDFAMNCLDLNAGWVDISDLFGVTSPDYRVFKLRKTSCSCPNYYKYVFQMCYSEKIFYSLTQGVTESYRRLPAQIFNNFKVPVPPYDEQVEIGKYLDKEISEINSVIAQKQEQLTVLADYKKSVIYEYVTGKKEVGI